MLALSGFPLFFSGFWSKDEILHAASLWSVSRIPFYLGITGSLLTAFYMTRQVCYVFFGQSRLNQPHPEITSSHSLDTAHPDEPTPHESPAVMTTPLIVLAAGTLLLSIIGTPAWPWFHAFLTGETAALNFSSIFQSGLLTVMLASSVIVFLGLGLGWWLYGGRSNSAGTESDALERAQPQVFRWLQNGVYVDALYRATFIRLNALCSIAADWFDRKIWSGAVEALSSAVVALSKLDSGIDNRVVNRSFDAGCGRVADGGRIMSRLQSGFSQNYLRLAAAGVAVLILFLMWGG
jgi:NADH-quinone oxidoreductase subunit L